MNALSAAGAARPLLLSRGGGAAALVLPRVKNFPGGGAGAGANMPASRERMPLFPADVAMSSPHLAMFPGHMVKFPPGMTRFGPDLATSRPNMTIFF